MNNVCGQCPTYARLLASGRLTMAVKLLEKFFVSELGAKVRLDISSLPLDVGSALSRPARVDAMMRVPHGFRRQVIGTYFVHCRRFFVTPFLNGVLTVKTANRKSGCGLDDDA